MTTTTSPVRDRATILRTELGIHEHFAGFTWEWLVKYDNGGSQGIGLWALDGKPTTPYGERTATAYGMAFIVALLAAAGVSHWEKLVGRPIVVLRDGHRGTAVGIAPADGEPGTPFLFADVSQAVA